MKFAQMAKRVGLFILVNLLVMVTISILIGLAGMWFHLPRGGLQTLAVYSLIYGFAGALISLALSRVMAKWMMGVQVIPTDTSDPDLRELVQMVHGLAQQARLPEMPQVGIYESPDINAFATGPTKSRALVAVSTGLMSSMRRSEVEGVLGHEIAHIANGDMVTMTLLQGVVNAFAFFLSRLLAMLITQAMRSRDDRDSGGGGWVQFLMAQVFEMFFLMLGAIVVCWFSRQREYRADAGGARFAGREKMIGALQALQRLHDPEVIAAAANHNQAFQAMQISGRSGGLMALFSSHPPLEERIARLQQATR